MTLDDLDAELHDYASRWRASQPAAPVVDTALLPTRERNRRWLPRWVPIVAVAASVAVVAGGIGFLRSPEPHDSASDVVPWLALPPSHPNIPTRSAVADPAEVEALSLCRADDLSIFRSMGAATGTRTITLSITSATRCRLAGQPVITALDPAGQTLGVDIEPDTELPRYNLPVLVAPETTATLTVTWSAGWCAPDITVATLSFALPGGNGRTAVEGFGPSSCNGTPGSGEKVPIRVGTFTPFDLGGERTAFEGLSATSVLPESVPAGGRWSFEVVLTARTDVPLAVCPDFLIRIGRQGNQAEADHALNCAAVSYKDSQGRPYLPAGVPVTFAMEADAPAAPMSSAKVTWQLVTPDGILAGGVVDVR
jgi:hypothetical protein